MYMTTMEPGHNQSHSQSQSQSHSQSQSRLLSTPEIEGEEHGSTSRCAAKQQMAAATSSSSWLQLGLPQSEGGDEQEAILLDLNLGGVKLAPPSFDHLPIIPPPSYPFSDRLLHMHMDMDMSGRWGSSSYAPPGVSMTTHPFLPAPPSSSSSDFRLLHPLHLHLPPPPPPPPPRHLHARPPAAIWFVLQASLHQSREPLLPQLSKSFLRIKDGRMTVGLVMKYVANKLGLLTASQVEIRCREQVLEPFLTLQHVRDQIWSRSEAVILLPNSSTSPHLMLLEYGSTSSSST
ncbi:hypothetical protein vseg_020124 [Gypsophila vaccaria]